MMKVRKEDGRDLYLVIHGHFYQPPRENPWIETIEQEHGAEPYHNWNARITDECYRRNGRSRVFDDRGRALQIVNNYRLLSFNFGATLLSWMQIHEPDVYRLVLEADRLSARERGGHGNALAQAYGHAILPLCNERDRRTQLRWGKRDFIFRFGREPAAMWLPETAVNGATVESLIDEGLRFIVLAPGQARRVRPLGRQEWTEVSGARIDPRHPYRIFSRRDRQRYIDAFFYDGPVSHSISFERILHSSHALVDKLAGAVDQGRRSAQLVHAAVDGETFGHHVRHADRALAYALTTAAPARGFRITNYAQYLELHPPTHEVELEDAAGEGSAWSCTHGVGRWYRDCGCSAGAPAGWNQAWRTPLREAVNYVRDRAADLYEEQGGELLVDVWAARDDYIDLLLDGAPDVRQRFIVKHCRGGATAHPVRMLQLLEMQRHSLLAQTSCGWFFNDISGLEAVQSLRYAARAVQLIEELSGQVVEPQLLELLAQARSNIPSHGTGADVYRSRVLPSVVDIRRIAAQHAITGIHRNHPDQYARYGFKLHQLSGRNISSGPVTVNVGRVQVEHQRTTETADLIYALIHFGSHDFHCAVRPFAGQKAFRAFSDNMESIFEKPTVTRLLRAIDAHFGEGYFGLGDLLLEERQQVLELLFGHLHESFGQLYAQLYEMHRRSIGALIDAGFQMPQEFRMAAEYALSHQLQQEIEAQRQSLDPGHYGRALELVAETRARGYRLDKAASQAYFGRMLERIIEQIISEAGLAHVDEAVQLIELAEQLDLVLPRERSQDLVHDALRQAIGRPEADRLREVATALLQPLHLAPGFIDHALAPHLVEPLAPAAQIAVRPADLGDAPSELSGAAGADSISPASAAAATAEPTENIVPEHAPATGAALPGSAESSDTASSQ